MEKWFSLQMNCGHVMAYLFKHAFLVHFSFTRPLFFPYGNLHWVRFYLFFSYCVLACFMHNLAEIMKTEWSLNLRKDQKKGHF